MSPTTTWAVAIDLQLLPDTGRHHPLPGGSSPERRFTYRPNWGLPGWPDGEQTAAPVLGFSRANLHPGESVRAVIVPLFPEAVPAWSEVLPDDELRMYEGLRLCGVGTVLWAEQATLPMPDDEQEQLLCRLAVPQKGGRP
ncbi:hypothetical protein [Paenarthrobacter aurescens]|uniref:hypothetical protein n=1 Tax=Paenarthrobacter aurescens TaxID=43663 RepID=UPI0011438F73|nr:hypothetical protein [Paenarthrobacter aurescens]MDO6144561.1 hypothetical protein [Paenarthrobacter aurescens]MDO6148406.1 hypothetical protein [Paenarthrobacter aurescens]MDO6159652.1 hypothetical protein [Paenarthrobacter aurescens]MDO6164554.1 hypothetical protein [Paenarthrobacter aurescens]